MRSIFGKINQFQFNFQRGGASYKFLVKMDTTKEKLTKELRELRLEIQQFCTKYESSNKKIQQQRKRPNQQGWMSNQIFLSKQ